MINFITTFLREEDGNAVEYALIVGLIGLAVSGAIGVMNGSITNAFNAIGSLFNSVQGGGGTGGGAG